MSPTAPLPEEHRVAVLISGRGSNLAALLSACRDGRVPAPIALVVSNVAGAAGLEHALEAGVPTVVIDHRESKTREEHDRRVAAALEEAGVTLLCLAGYMRLLSPWFVDRYRDRILNVHPSLLPAFPGLDAQRQALEHGVKVSGCTVHLVNEDLDAGAIVLQAAVPVLEDDDEEALSRRILEQEHRIYPEALGKLCRGEIVMDSAHVRDHDTTTQAHN